MQSINPLDQSVVGEVPDFDPGGTTELVERSARAQKRWSQKTAEERAEVLKPAAEVLMAHKQELGELISREMGKPVSMAAGEVGACASSLMRELPEMVEAFAPQILENDSTQAQIVTSPLGVSVAITPWNFPILMPHWQILPALMAGNSVIFKPSEETPLIGQAYADILNQFLPEDVLIPVHGDGRVGAELVKADNVRLITFTGSRATGGRIMQEASKTLKRVILELGGKDPLLVLEGADLEAAADFAVRNGFRNSGQVCVSTERVYVDQSIADDFVHKVTEKTNALKVGNGLEEGTDVGPMVNERQKNIVATQVQQAVNDGANMMTGELSSAGNFVSPTVLTGVSHSMSVMRDETFGPVLGIMSVESPEQAVELANDTPYGLGAVVFAEPDLAQRVATQLDAGMVGINKGVSGVSGTPWVGAKESGYGFHSGPEGHRQFVQVKVLSRPK